MSKTSLKFGAALAAISLGMLAAQPVLAQAQNNPTAKDSTGRAQEPAATSIWVAPSGGANGPGTVVARDFGFPVNCITGCSGSGGGSLSAKANAAAQSSTEGATTDPLSMDLSRYLRVTAKQDGGTSWNVGITGTLPAFASTPTFNIGGTLPAFASTPTFNIGGTLPAFASTPAFSISGTLPAFAATPTFNCGTGCGSLSAKANASPQTSTEGATTDPLSMNLNRQLRVALGDPTTGTDWSLSDFRPSSSSITAADVATTSTAGQNSINQITGTPTAGSYVSFAVNGMTSVNITSSGTFVATSQIEGSVDAGAHYHALTGILLGSGGAVKTSTLTGIGSVQLSVAGYDHIRVRATSYTSGSQTISLEGTSNAGNVRVTNPFAVVDSGGGDVSDTTNHTVGTSPGINSSGKTPLIQADQTPFLNMTTATTTKIVTGASSKKTYITEWDWLANGTTTTKLVYGTGTNCGTGTTDATPTYNATAQVGISKGTGIGPVVIIPASQDTCVFNGQAVNLGVQVAATQF